MKNLVNNTKAMLTLPQKTILHPGDNHVADGIVADLEKHPVVAQMIKEKKVELKAVEAKKEAPKKDAKKVAKKEEK